jgi:putative membrane protein
MLRITLAVLHLLALGIGLGAIYTRARSLNALGSAPDALRRAFVADAWWGVAALLWIGTGLWRALAGTEKASGYYWSNHVFLAKMGLLLVVLLLELVPMVALIGWRRAAAAGTLPAPELLVPKGRRLARISDVQTLLVVAIVVAAVLMARGYGARSATAPVILTAPGLASTR